MNSLYRLVDPFHGKEVGNLITYTIMQMYVYRGKMLAAGGGGALRLPDQQSANLMIKAIDCGQSESTQIVAHTQREIQIHGKRKTSKAAENIFTIEKLRK